MSFNLQLSCRDLVRENCGKMQSLVLCLKAFADLCVKLACSLLDFTMHTFFRLRTKTS